MLYQSSSSPPMGPALQREFPEVESYVRLLSTDMLVRHGDIVFNEEECYFADSTLFKVFSFPLIAGDERTALTEPHSLVLTRSAAQRYFGNGEALGRTPEIDKETYKITGGNGRRAGELALPLFHGGVFQHLEYSQ